MNDAVPLHEAYRPLEFAEVIGQDNAVEAMERMLTEGSSYAYLLSGPSGVGKTTLARIGARQLGCAAKDILEIDAATYNGVEDMRRIQETLRYQPLGEGTSRAVIIDECHMASRSAFNSLLKVLEKPPGDTVWFLCTTELSKVIETVRQRCISIKLQPVKAAVLKRLVKQVAKAEGFEVPDDIVELVVNEASGSPRLALGYLETVRGTTNRQKAKEQLAAASETSTIIALCRILSNHESWVKAAAVLRKLEEEEENPEAVRIVVSNYMQKVLRDAKSDRAATYLLTVLDNFATAYNASDRMAPLYLSVGRVLLGGE